MERVGTGRKYDRRCRRLRLAAGGKEKHGGGSGERMSAHACKMGGMGEMGEMGGV
jgi:hypothetical protein